MRTKKLYIFLLLLLTSINIPGPLKAMLENTPELYNILDPDDIGLAKSFLIKKFVKNIYLYAPKKDPLRILIRTLWHIFYGQESDQIMPTKKGPLAVITPEIFGEIINYLYTNSGDQEKNLFIDKLINKHNWVKLYTQYLPQEIRDIENIIIYLKGESEKIDKKLCEIEKNLEQANNKKTELACLFETNLKNSNTEKTKKLLEINAKFIKKSQEKETAIKLALQEINKKYDINNFKILKENINLEIIKLKEEKLATIRDQKNIKDELENKNLELAYKIKISQSQEIIELEILSTIRDIISKIRQASASQIYLPRITYGVLWAFFLSKFNTKEDLNICLQQINLKNKKDPELTYTEFKKNLCKKDPASGLCQNYAQSLCNTIKQAQSPKFPQEITMGRFVCELSPGKISDKFSDCFECAMLNLVNILLYNPFTEKYDQTIIPQNCRSGTGYKKVIKALKCAYLADKNKIKEIDYSLQNKQINFTSLKKLKAKLQEFGITKMQINATKLGDINSSLMTSALVRQRWINIVSGLSNIQYNQDNQDNQADKKCEILPLISNFINLLNFFYGTNASKIQALGPLLSFGDTESPYRGQREVSFELKDGDRPVITVNVNHSTKDLPSILFSIKITLMKHHTTLEILEKNQKQNSLLENLAQNLATEICSNFNSEMSQKLIPFFILAANKKTLKNLPLDPKLDPKLIRLAYYALNIQDPKTQLAIVKHALNNNLLRYPDIKKLIFKLKNKLCLNTQLEYKLIEYIIKSGAYKNYPELKEYITKRATQTLGVICGANINLDGQEFYDLYKYLVNSGNGSGNGYGSESKNWSGDNINAKCEPNGDTLLIKAIKIKDFDLAKKLISTQKINIAQTGEYKATALHIAAISGNIEIINTLLDNPKIDNNTANALDDKNNTPLNLAIENNRLQAVKFMLNHPKINIPTQKTPLHSCCVRNNETMLKFLLTNPKTNNLAPDYNNNMPVHIAAFYGHTNLVQILVNLPGQDIANIINKPGYKNRTALNLAAKNNKKSVVSWLLKQPKIDPNIPDSGNYTPLNRAVKNKFTEVTLALLSREDTDVNLPDRWGYSPLFWATKKELLVALLNDKRLRINHQDKRLKTALYWASTKGWTPIVKTLLTHKEIKTDIANFLGKTPLSVARAKGYTEIANLIEKHKII